MAVCKPRHHGTVALAANGTGGAKEWRLPKPAGGGRFKVYVYNETTAFKVRVCMGQGGTPGTGIPIFPSGGDEFFQNDEELVIVPDAGAGNSVCTVTVYEEMIVPGTGGVDGAT